MSIFVLDTPGIVVTGANDNLVALEGVLGQLATNNDNDTASASASSGPGVNGNVAATNDDDTSSSVGSFGDGVSGSLSIITADDAVQSAGTFGQGLLGSSAITDENDSAAIQGSSQLGILGNVVWLDASDTVQSAANSSSVVSSPDALSDIYNSRANIELDPTLASPFNDIQRFRGDTVPDERTLFESGTIKDLTGFAFFLTVNNAESPENVTEQIFQTGALVDPESGRIQFAPQLADVDRDPAVYYYDIQMTTPQGYIKTIDKGEYEFLQDITKD